MTGTAPAAEPVTVLCMKWGAKYGPEYVNRLYGMVARNLARPFRLVCLTDDPMGVRPEVTCAPIPPLPPFDQPKERGWRKIASFSPDLAGLLPGVVLFLDVDVVIVGPLDPLFEAPGEFPMIRDWYHHLRVVGNSSVYRYRLAERRDVFDYFCAHADAVVRRRRNEQEYLTWLMARKGALAFWPAAWCRSYRAECLPPWPLRLWRAPAAPPGSRVLVFHGDPKPPEAIAGRKRGLLAFQPAPWIERYWRE